MDCYLRVPSGVPLPASGLSAASELSLESTQRGATATGSQRAECAQRVDSMPASGLKAPDSVVPLPTFPILRAGESHYREKTKFPELAETSSFLRIRSYPVSFLSETPVYKRNGSSVGVRSFVKLASRSDPIAGATAARG